MNKVKYFREKEGLTRTQLAEILGIHKDYVSAIETGKRRPSFKLAKSIADCFVTTVDELNFFNEPSNKTYDEAS